MARLPMARLPMVQLSMAQLPMVQLIDPRHRECMACGLCRAVLVPQGQRVPI